MRLTRRIGAGQQARRDAGLTLPELLIAMSLTGVLLAALASLFIGATKTTHGTQNRLEEVNDGRVAISIMGRAMRTAILPNQLFDVSSTDTSAFISATPTSLRFYANIDNPANSVGPTKVTYGVAAGVLTQITQTPNPFVPANPVYVYCAPGAGCPTKTKILARGVLTSSPIFRYYDSLGNELIGSPLNDDQLDAVDSVDISVTVSKPGSGGNGTTFALRIAMPNHDAVQRLEDEETTP
jgi:prepilin-type N-terminal cleavage/methylation domain-containing protein